MSSRNDPLWFCHECNAEMRPLMVPDPHCASCNGTFVEMLDNADDDPRDQGDQGDQGQLPGLAELLSSMGIGPRPQSPRRRETATPSQGTSSLRIEIGGGNGRGTRTFTFGGPNTIAPPRDPTGEDEMGAHPLSELFRGHLAGGPILPPNRDGRNPAMQQNLLAHYLMHMLGGGTDHMFAPHGQMGDYVFDQGTLDRVMTQLMEAGSHHPVPATEKIIEDLPRTVLEPGDTLLTKDCAVCKDTFSLEDPEELLVVTLPCKHSFHEDCIEPWLKQSGTCPVCRHALIAQHDNDNDNTAARGGGGLASPFRRLFGQRSPGPHSDGGGDDPRFPGGW